MATDPGDQRPITIIELTEEEKDVLKECRRNSVYFRGFPLGAISVILLRQAVGKGYFPNVKRFSGLYYTGLFALSFTTGVASYRSECTKKIMKLENSRLADQIRGVYQRAGIPHNYGPGGEGFPDQQNVDMQGSYPSSDTASTEDLRYGGSQETTHLDDYSATPSGSMTPPRDQVSNEEAPAPPSLYFEVDKAKENKYTSYDELRKKHRDRWSPPNVSSSGSSRLEQPRHEGDRDSRTGFNETPGSWFDRDSEERNSSETGQNTSGRQNRTPYRPGQPAKKNKYGDMVE